MARLAQLATLIASWPIPVLVRCRPGQSPIANPRWQEVFGETVWPTTDTLPGAQGSVWRVQTTGLQGVWADWEVAIAQDASDWARLGVEVRDRACEVARLQQTQDEFLRRAAHELKTPLTTIGGMAGLLYREGSAVQRARAGMLRRSVRQLAKTVDNLVDWAAATTDTLPLHYQQMDVQRLCQQAIAAVRAEFAGEALPDFDLTVPTGLPPLVADPRRCQQILVELLTNAVKYGQGAIALKVQQPPDWWVFSVEHGGPGIPPQRQGEIFQRVGQMEPLPTRQMGGGGVGLALIQHLARLHGGEVSFLSQPGVATVFSVWLPQRSPTLMAPVWSGGQEVLVGSPQADRLYAVSQVLGDWGFRPMIARSGREVLDKVGRVPPMAVLLDEDFPDLTREELLCLLARQGCPATILALRQPAVGTQGHWSEPFAPETLVRVWPQPSPGLRVMAVGLAEEALRILQGLPLRLLVVDSPGAIARWWRPDVVVAGSHLSLPRLSVPVVVWPEHRPPSQPIFALQEALGYVRTVGLVGPPGWQRRVAGCLRLGGWHPEPLPWPLPAVLPTSWLVMGPGTTLPKKWRSRVQGVALGEMGWGTPLPATASPVEVLMALNALCPDSLSPHPQGRQASRHC
ncbi:MAG: ATP-binding protein [Pseudanabaenaceae cyanobacterium]